MSLLSLFRPAAGGGTAWSQPLADTITASDALTKAAHLTYADSLTSSDVMSRRGVLRTCIGGYDYGL